jgi:hypothetical protein
MALTDPQAEPQEIDYDAVAVEVDAEVRVPRGELGDLPAGVAEVLAGVEGVTTVDIGELEAVRPAALDIYVDVTGRLEGDFGDRDAGAMAALVGDAFGVETVHAVAVEYERGHDDPPNEPG